MFSKETVFENSKPNYQFLLGYVSVIDIYIYIYNKHVWVFSLHFSP